MTGSEFQEIWREIRSINERLQKIEEKLNELDYQPITEEPENDS